MQLNNTTIYFIGAVVILIAGTIVKRWFTKFIDKKFDSIYDYQERNEKERERDNFMSLRGQQVTCDCLHHLNYAMIHGDHVEELEKCDAQLDAYRALLNETITEKASRWNIQIGR